MNQPPLNTLIRIKPSSACATDEKLAPRTAIRATSVVRNPSERMVSPLRLCAVLPHVSSMKANTIGVNQGRRGVDIDVAAGVRQDVDARKRPATTRTVVEP